MVKQEQRAIQRTPDLLEEDVSEEFSETRGGGYAQRLSETKDPNRWFIELEKASANECTFFLIFEVRAFFCMLISSSLQSFSTKLL